MTSLLDRRVSAASEVDATGDTRRLPRPQRTRRPLVMMASAVVVFASVFSFATLYSSSHHQLSVLVVVRPLQEGQRITGADLGQVSLSVSTGVTPIPVTDAPRLAGLRAVAYLPAGSVLIAADVTGSPPVPAGDGVVGLELKGGQLPSTGVRPGDQVMVVQTSSPGTPIAPATSGSFATSGALAGTEAGVLVPEATVFSTALPPANSSSGATELVSVEVAASLAAAVTTAAAADQVSLVLLPAGPTAGSQP